MSRVPASERVWFYWLVRNSVWLGLKVWERFETHGSENVPAEGGCIIAANHVSYLDPPAVSGGVGHRLVRFMARDTLFKPGFPHFFMTHVRCVPIDRTRGDVAALRAGIRVLKEGGVLALFPEGTRSLDGQLKEAKGGIGFLMAKAEVPVVPAYIDGTFQAFPKGAKRVKPGRVRIFFGKAILPEELAECGKDRDSYDKIGKLVMARIAALRPS